MQLSDSLPGATPGPDTAPMANKKIQRWLDLLAFLTRHRFPVTRGQIMDGVPAYRRALDEARGEGAGGTEGDRGEGADSTGSAPAKDPESVRRMFERDKKGLLELGLPLETVELGHRGAEDDEQVGYRLRSRDFYLPYLRILKAGRAMDTPDAGDPDAPARPATGPRASLPRVELELEDLEAVHQGLDLLSQVPDFPWGDEVRSARRTLSFDLHETRSGPPTAPVIVRSDPAEVAGRTAVLTRAMELGKCVTFTYAGAYRDAVTDRKVHPWGLLFKLNHWYLVGRDLDREAVRVFRLGRMSELAMNTRRPGTPDFQRPADFSLAPWRDAHAWSLPSDDATETEVRVHFDFPQSLLAERNDMGSLETRGANGAQVRVFRARQVDALLRWLLTLQGEARPLSPPEVVRAWQSLVRSVAHLYREPVGTPAGSTLPDEEEPA